MEGFNAKNILDMLLLNGIKEKDEKAYKAIKVFQRHGISVYDAIAILTELGLVMGDENNE